MGLINLCQYSIEEYILYFLNHQYIYYVSIICTQSKKSFLTSSCGSNVNIKKYTLTVSKGCPTTTPAQPINR